MINVLNTNPEEERSLGMIKKWYQIIDLIRKKIVFFTEEKNLNNDALKEYFYDFTDGERKINLRYSYDIADNGEEFILSIGSGRNKVKIIFINDSSHSNDREKGSFEFKIIFVDKSGRKVLGGFGLQNGINITDINHESTQYEEFIKKFEEFADIIIDNLYELKSKKNTAQITTNITNTSSLISKVLEI